MKTDSDLATLFAALAHPSRVAILRDLLAHANQGRQFGELSKDLLIPASTLTHHLNEMEKAGILNRETQGRATRLGLNLDALAQALQQLTRLCCAADFAQPTQTEAAK